MTAPPIEKLTSTERTLATTMIRGFGRETLQAVSNAASLEGTVEQDDFDRLVDRYAEDPKELLAHARESLLSIAHDTTLTRAEKGAKLDQHLDAYFDLTTELNHQAFPTTAPGEVREGTPEYIPDGFIDMGREQSLNPNARDDREQIHVDKRALFEKHKVFLKDLFSNTFEGLDLQKKKQALAIAISGYLYSKIPYNTDISEGKKTLGGDKVKLSEMPDGVCRHQALEFQVLCQAVGLKTRMLKALRDVTYHSTNMARFDGDWYIYDVTAPDYKKDDAGNKLWKPGILKVDRPPLPGERKVYKTKARFSGEEHKYIAHDKMFWRIEHED